ncbi:MAG: response regulator [Actinomycetota bacterium]
MSVRVVLADDHLVVRTGLRGMLESDADVEIVGEASTGHEAIEIAASSGADLVLMDLRMPELDGAAATKQLRERHPAVQVLILTTYDTDADILRAIEAGATGYLLKDATRDELLRAIHMAAAGESALAPSVASRLVDRMRSPRSATLSAREIEILELVAKGLSNKETGARLYISEATVKTHLLHVFSKLGVSDRTQAVTEAVGRGIVRLEH